MKIIEARDGFINFEADESVYLSMFIQAEGVDKSYIAQVNQMKKFGNVLIAGARILFLYNGLELMNYDRTLPSKDAEIKPFEVDILGESVSAKNPVIVGKTLDNSRNVFMDLSVFDKKTLISVDDGEMNNLLVRNLTKQFENFEQKVVIIDTLGIVSGKKYIAGKDFKLPLDTSTLAFMYESCLNDATQESKATIAEVFRDLSEYSKTVPFVPFDVLKSIVDDMVDKQHIFRLFVLKNRLANFQKLGYFATGKEEVDALDKILSSNVSIIDLSKLNSLFQNRYLDFIYSKIDAGKSQVILELSNTISKKNLKNVIRDSDVHTLFVTHPKFAYLSDIKEMFDNFIIESSVVNNELFKIYSTFFSSMKKGMYLTVGSGVNYIPMVSQVQNIDDVMIPQDAEPIVSENSETDYNEEQAERDYLADAVSELSAEEDERIKTEDESSYSAEFQENALSQDEIIAEIEQKSNDVIEAVSENLTEPSELDLFGGGSEAENDEADEAEFMEEFIEQSSPVDEIQSETDIIVPQYKEIEPSVNDSEISEYEELRIEETSEIDSAQDDLASFSEEQSFEAQENDIIPDDNIDSEVVPEEVLLEDNADEILDKFAEPDMDSIQDESFQDNEQELNLDTGIENFATELLSNEENNDISDESEEISISQEDELSFDENELPENVSEEENIVSDVSDDIADSELEALSEEITIQEEDEFAELNPNETQENDIIIDITEDEEPNIIDEELNQQIIDDVDKVYTTLKTDDELEEISDSDLDFIDELNSDEDQELEEYSGELEEVSDSSVDDSILDQPEEGIVPQRQSSHKSSSESEILEKRDSNTPIVPVYDADIPQEDMVVSDVIQQGDSVVHAKYGNGVVEKMIKYGTKNLFSINFENIGRRLLDPTLTEIKKL